MTFPDIYKINLPDVYKITPSEIIFNFFSVCNEDYWILKYDIYADDKKYFEKTIDTCKKYADLEIKFEQLISKSNNYHILIKCDNNYDSFENFIIRINGCKNIFLNNGCNIISVLTKQPKHFKIMRNIIDTKYKKHECNFKIILRKIQKNKGTFIISKKIRVCSTNNYNAKTTDYCIFILNNKIPCLTVVYGKNLRYDSNIIECSNNYQCTSFFKIIRINNNSIGILLKKIIVDGHIIFSHNDGCSNIKIDNFLINACKEINYLKNKMTVSGGLYFNDPLEFVLNDRIYGKFDSILQIQYCDDY